MVHHIQVSLFASLSNNLTSQHMPRKPPSEAQPEADLEIMMLPAAWSGNKYMERECERGYCSVFVMRILEGSESSQTEKA